VGHHQGTNFAAGTGPVVDHKWLTEFACKLSGDDTGNDVGRTAGWEWNDKVNRPRWPFFLVALSKSTRVIGAKD
jgi:hypothetical protein